MDKLRLFFLIRLKELFGKYLAFSIFLLVALIILLADILFNLLFPGSGLNVTNLVNSEKNQTSIDFAPEVWLAVLSMVLGTLIIVISIASQSTPKLIDLYIKDKKSLMYIWFITLSAGHNLILQLYLSTGEFGRLSSVLLNTYILLPITLILAIPYILYILRYTKPSNVIQKIYLSNIQIINRLQRNSKVKGFFTSNCISNYQFSLFDSLNQLDDLLEYVSFKEPKGDIIHNMGESVQKYIRIKKELKKSFFEISPIIQNDISFKTMTGQFEEIEKSSTFYEQKAFRLLANAYLKLVDNNHFDLASLCVYELSECGKYAVLEKDSYLIDVINIRFNTFLRFGIKHGLRNSEVRNLYNALFHYSQYLNYLVESKMEDNIKTSCNYLKIYGTEVYKHSQLEPSFSFLVDVFTLELKKILIQLNELDFSRGFQKQILEYLLEMDSPPDIDRDELGRWRIVNDGVRVLQIGLSLYYISVGSHVFAERIIDDILEDYTSLKENLKIAVEASCKKLNYSTPTFWEDTDRGSTNLYYTAEKEFIPEFIEMFNRKHDLYLAQRKS
ncbi:MAG: hypothetical protein ISR55_04170 [Bacteroidetes bacterium]|nr:hypothetical protein [Bacteroidota bacterium]MBL6962995.1 hypothetical protein [Bacteroidota bacterium]